MRMRREMEMGSELSGERKGDGNGEGGMGMGMKGR
jgi:hypothetical protein